MVVCALPGGAHYPAETLTMALGLYRNADSQLLTGLGERMGLPEYS